MRTKDKLKVSSGIIVLVFIFLFVIKSIINMCGGNVSFIDILEVIGRFIILAAIIWILKVFFEWAFKPLEK